MTDTIRPLVIPVFIPFAGCPHRCVFCNQKIITAAKTPVDSGNPSDGFGINALPPHIQNHLKQARSSRYPIEIAFFGGNFLGLPFFQRQKLLEIAQHFVDTGQVHGIRFSTRPDTVTPETLASLKPYTIRTVELGVQSMNDAVLACSQRGHTAQDTRQAMGWLRQAPYRLGCQLMIGLPEDTPERLHQTGKAVADLQPDFARLYPTLVFSGSQLAAWYHQGRYRPLSLEEALEQTAALYRQLRQKGIIVSRMGLQPPSEGFNRNDLLAGPWHPAFGELVRSRIFLSLALDLLTHELHGCPDVSLQVHPRNLSVLIGHRRSNLHHLKALVHPRPLTLETDTALGETVLAGCSGNGHRMCWRDYGVRGETGAYWPSQHHDLKNHSRLV